MPVDKIQFVITTNHIKENYKREEGQGQGVIFGPFWQRSVLSSRSKKASPAHCLWPVHVLLQLLLQRPICTGLLNMPTMIQKFSEPISSLPWNTIQFVFWTIQWIYLCSVRCIIVCRTTTLSASQLQGAEKPRNTMSQQRFLSRMIGLYAAYKSSIMSTDIYQHPDLYVHFRHAHNTTHHRPECKYLAYSAHNKPRNDFFCRPLILTMLNQ